MLRLIVLLILLLSASSSWAADNRTPGELRDLYYGETLYYALQGEWFDAVARLDTELAQHHRLDQPEMDSLYYHIDQAEFAVGDFELAYRMHRRAGRAITAVIEGNVGDAVRNEALFRLARLYYRKDQPLNAVHALERIDGEVPAAVRDDLDFLRAQVFITVGRFSDAIAILKELRGAAGLEGFASYNLGIALLRSGLEEDGRKQLDLTGQLVSERRAALAIRDKANLLLGEKLLGGDDFGGAKGVLDRVRLNGPFSNRALLGSGWADAKRDDYARALVPWSLLSELEITDSAVQEGMLAVPYAYGKLGVFSKAALMYGRALEAFGGEVDKLDASIKSIREGRFLAALVRKELEQDANWVVRLRELPETPETYYLLDMMAAHDFQSSLQNYSDLEELRRRLTTWQGDLDAFEEIITLRRAYYEPLLPEIDAQFRLLDSQMRLRLEQRDRIEKRLNAMLVAPRPDYLITAVERIAAARIAALRRQTDDAASVVRLERLRGVLDWNIVTNYDRRLTEAHTHLRDLNQEIERLNRQYSEFVRVRQAATQSYQGYTDTIRRQRMKIVVAREQVDALMARQGHLIEVMAVNELTARRQKLEEYQVKARFAMADSYDRAARKQEQKEEQQ